MKRPNDLVVMEGLDVTDHIRRRFPEWSNSQGSQVSTCQSWKVTEKLSKGRNKARRIFTNKTICERGAAG